MSTAPGRTIVPIGRIGPNGVSLLGTAFAVGTKIFATTAHSLGHNDEKLCIIIPSFQDISEYQDTTDNRIATTLCKIKEFDPIRDIAILEAPDVTCDLNYSLSSTDLCPTGSGVLSAGYPHADHGRMVLTQQSSTVGTRILLGTHLLKSKHIVMNVQAKPGQSGSPVFLGSSPTITAMLVGSYAPTGAGGLSLGGIDPHTLHQTTHAISAEYIKAMI